MTRESHTVINVALRGHHFFRVEIPGHFAAAHTTTVIDELHIKFPVSEGYQIDITFWQVSGVAVAWVPR